MSKHEKKLKDKQIASRYLRLISDKSKNYLSDSQLMQIIADEEQVSYSVVRKIITKKE
jgi:hypothetical protein